MKKKITIALFVFLQCIFFVSAQFVRGEFFSQTPKQFFGIWEGQDRFVMFANEIAGEQNYVTILLKTFYGWHLDRAAEPLTFEKKNARILNNSTCQNAQQIRLEYQQIFANANFFEQDSSVWEIFLFHPQTKEAQIIPVAIIGKNLYLDFAIKIKEENPVAHDSTFQNTPSFSESPSGIFGFWARTMTSDGIKICKSIFAKDIYSFYIVPDEVYAIRYWKTEMEYSKESAFFLDGEKTFFVPKHIQSAGKIFTCTNGRSNVIRNVEKQKNFLQNCVFNESKTLCGFGEPYLKCIQNEDGSDAIFALLKNAAQKKAPLPPLPFPPSDLDFHMSEIYRLEKENLVIQNFRERNKKFESK